MEYIYIGKIVNTHGIKGEVRILSNFKYKSKVLTKYFKIYIDKNKYEEVINSYRPHKQFDMITLVGIDNINDVLKYKSKNVYIKRSDLILDEGEYLDEDLIGLNVIVNDEVVGKIIRIEKDRYQGKIVVNKGGTTCWVPSVCDIIDKIDIKGGCITIKYIKGLLD